MAFGEIIFNLTDLYCAALAADNTFSGPARIPYVQDFKFDFEHDTDELKASGVTLELLSVPTGARSEATEARLDWVSWPVLVGAAEVAAGVTPNLTRTMELAGGGGGVPYHGLLAVFASTNNSAVAVGFCKSKVSQIPGFDQAQNEFRKGSIEWMHVAGSDTGRKFFKAVKYESAAGVPDFALAASWDTFFTGYFS